MSLFGFAGCMLNSHEPLRREVEWNGVTYVGSCRHCGAPIERLKRRTWRKRNVAEADESRGSPG